MNFGELDFQKAFESDDGIFLLSNLKPSVLVFKYKYNQIYYNHSAEGFGLVDNLT